MDKGRKYTGAKYHANRKKKKFERSKQMNSITLGDPKAKKVRVKGGEKKTILLSANTANVSDGKKIQKVEITNVLETPQNKFWARQNRLLKGAVIETSLGKARITNRPSREGSVNALLIE